MDGLICLRRLAWTVAAVSVVCLLLVSVEAVNRNRYEQLTRGELIALDWDVSGLYDVRYENTTADYEQHLFRALRAFRHTTVLNQHSHKYSSRELMRLSQGAQVDETLCAHQLELLKQLLDQKVAQPNEAYGPNSTALPLSAINFLDSGGQVEGGLLNGNSHWPGSPASCQRARIPPTHFGQGSPTSSTDKPIQGRYCVAHMRAKSWPERDIYFEDRISIKVGVCLPQSCHSLQFHENSRVRRQVDHLARHQLAGPFNGPRYEVFDLYCLPDEDSPLRQWDLGTWLFYGFLATWLLLVLYASLKYSYLPKQSIQEDIKIKISPVQKDGDENEVSVKEVLSNGLKRRPERSGDTNKTWLVSLTKALAVQPNLEYLLKSSRTDWRETANNATKEDGEKSRLVNVNLFDGIKVLATTYIIVGHTVMFYFGLVSDMRFFDEHTLDFTIISIMNTLQVVGLFYIITGALLTYLCFSRHRHQLKRPLFWLLVVVGRYARLMPAYLLVFWFARHAAPFTGSGPHWFDYRTDHEHCRTYCGQESWRVMLTMSAADVKIPLDCVPQTWYLSNDFRTLLVLPIYIVLLAMSPKAGYAAIFATFLVSSARLVHILRAANVDYMIIMDWKPHVFALLTDRLHDVYTELSIRLSTYLLGCTVGHLLHLYETRQISRWPTWFTSWGLKLSLLLGACSFLFPILLSSPQIHQFLPAASSLDSATTVYFIPLLKTGMECCISVVLLLMATGFGFSWLNAALSSPLARILSHLSYAVFLVHVEVMYKVPVVKLELSYWHIYQMSSLFIALSYAVAGPIHLLYEMPINNLTRGALKKLAKWMAPSGEVKE